MHPLWKIRSGEYAGFEEGGRLYDADGRNVGYFRGDVAYSTSGHCIGEIYRGDYIGKRSGIAQALSGAVAPYASRAVARHGNRAGLAIAGWDDPDF